MRTSTVVGYVDEGLLAENFSMIAIPFVNVNGGSIDLNTDVKFENVVKAEVADVENDYLHVYINDGTGYTFLYFHHDDYPEGHKWHMADGWYGAGDESLEDLFPPDGKLDVGTCMWYEAKPGLDREGPISVTFSGAVEDAPFVKLEELQQGNFNMIANPYPVAWNPSDENTVTFTGIVKAEVADVENDYLHVYINDGTGYTFLYFHHDDYPEGHKWHMADGWYGAGDEPLDELFPNGLIPANTAMWLESKPGLDHDEDLTVTFYSPLIGK